MDGYRKLTSATGGGRQREVETRYILSVWIEVGRKDSLTIAVTDRPRHANSLLRSPPQQSLSPASFNRSSPSAGTTRFLTLNSGIHSR